jgi:hypothetical protein
MAVQDVKLLNLYWDDKGMKIYSQHACISKKSEICVSMTSGCYQVGDLVFSSVPVMKIIEENAGQKS